MPTGPSNGRLKCVKLHSFGSERAILPLEMIFLPSILSCLTTVNNAKNLAPSPCNRLFRFIVNCTIAMGEG